MSNPKDISRHLRITNPSPWITRFAPLVPGDVAGGAVLDIAAGGGRHARVFLERGLRITAVDRTAEPLMWLTETYRDRAEVIEVDLEDDREGGGENHLKGGGRNHKSPFGPGGVLDGRTFAGVVVTNYLHRPLLPGLIAAIAPGGVLIYETFARGNEAFNRPRNPDHLLKSGELLEAVRGKMDVIAYEHGLIEKDAAIPGVIQRICAEKPGPSARDDGEPIARPVYPG